MPADLVIYAIIAAGLVFWLRSILGTRHGGERERQNPFARQAEEQRAAQKAAANQESSSMSDKASPALAGLAPGIVDKPVLERHMAIAAKAEEGLADVARFDRNFEPGDFLRGAQEAFVMIVEAFAAGDRETLKSLVDESVFAFFDPVIRQRDNDGQKSQVEIHAIRRAEIVEARMDRKIALVTVRFVADETNVLRDSDGKVLEGNPDRVSETIDVWTFMRDTKSREPGWYLVETRDDDAAGQDHKTVPDTK